MFVPIFAFCSVDKNDFGLRIFFHLDNLIPNPIPIKNQNKNRTKRTRIKTKTSKSHQTVSKDHFFVLVIDSDSGSRPLEGIRATSNFKNFEFAFL